MSSVALLRSCPQMNGCPLITARDLRRLDIAPKARVLVLAALVSGLVHLGAMAAMTPAGERALIAGGGEAAPAALGTSFEDFAAGSLSPSAPAPVPSAPTPLAPAATAATTAADMVAAPPDAALLPMPTPPDAATPLRDIRPELAEATPPERPEPAPADVARDEPMHAEPVRVEHEVIEPERVEIARATTPPPPARPDPTTPEPQPSPQASAPQGNAEQDARRGSQQASDQGQAANSAQAQQGAHAQGNAASSNYPGEVLRVIQRTRQARSPSRGRVLVAFSIGYGGELTAASVAQSSGHAGLDNAALDHIRRAAPFPPPPPGAQQQFSFEFVGR